MDVDRRRFLISSGAALGAGILASQGVFAAGPSSGFRGIRRQVGLFWGRGGTIGWLAGKDGVVAIDSQFPDTAAIFLDGLTTHSPRPVDLLINTHHHRDHTSGNPVFSAKGIGILAQEEVPRLQREAARRFEIEAEQVYADKTFTRRWKQSFGDEVVTATHYGPAHTGGDAVIHFENANVVHMGDLVFNRYFPFIDRLGGGSVVGWHESLEAALEQFDDETVFIFGHGTEKFGVSGGKADVALQRDYLAAVLERVRKGIAAGHGREEITAEDLLAAFPDHEAPNDRFTPAANLGIAYDELTGE